MRVNIRYHVAGLRRWLRALRSHGRPDHVLYFNGGIGDQLLCSAVAREIQVRNRRNIWLLTHVPDLFAANQDLHALPFDLALVPWARLMGANVRQMFYQEHIDGEGRDATLHEPIIAALCRRAGLVGPITLRPYLPAVTMTPVVRRNRPRIALQSSCLNARYAIANKQWPVERMQAVADALFPTADLIQLGTPKDPPLHGAANYRGGALISAANELASCDLFIGLVGFLMHLARAVECPAVIVYGGREPPELTGYSANTNVARQPPCSPCWQYSRCDHDRMCLTDIPAWQIVKAVHEMLARPPARPLPAEQFMICSA